MTDHELQLRLESVKGGAYIDASKWTTGEKVREAAASKAGNDFLLMRAAKQREARAHLQLQTAPQTNYYPSPPSMMGGGQW
jgi:hypothetical protein